MNDSIDTDDIVDLSAEYIAYLRIERGSSPRTIEAYEADLQKVPGLPHLARHRAAVGHHARRHRGL